MKPEHAATRSNPQAYLGQNGDVPVVGDWNGSGTKKMGVFRSGLWVLDYNGNFQWDGTTIDRAITLGQAGDVPVVGDWNGTPFDKVGVFRSGLWLLDYNGNGVWDGPGIDVVGNLGQSGDVPVVGDWNGSGTKKIGVFRSGLWVLDYNGNFQWDGPPADRYYGFGTTGDTPVVGRWVAPAVPPSLVSVTPSNNTGSQQTFTFLSSDADGGAYINSEQLLFASTSGGSGSACYFFIDPGSQWIWLRDDANTTWGQAVIASQAGTLSNGQCSLNAAGSSIGVSGVNLTVNLAVTFYPAFAGTHNITMQAVDWTGLDVGPAPMGTWMVGGSVQMGNPPAGSSFYVYNDNVARLLPYGAQCSGAADCQTTTCSVSGSNVTATAINKQQSYADISVSANSNAVAGNRTITCSASGLVSSAPVTVYDATPVVTSVERYDGPPGNNLFTQGEGLVGVRIKGTNFGSNSLNDKSRLAVSGSGVTVQYITWWHDDGTEIDVVFNIDSNALGPYTVTVTSMGASGQGFLSGGSPASQSKGGGQMQVAPAPQVRISRSGTGDITGQTVGVIVGQQINLTGTVANMPAGVTIQSQSWSVAGNRVAGYTRSNTAATVTPFSDPATANAVFYWIDGGTNTVGYTVNLSSGKSYSGTAQFTVARPTLTSWSGATTTLSPAIHIVPGTPPLLQFGYEIPPNPDPNTVYPGIEYNENVRIPAGGAGSLAVTQLVNTVRTRVRPDTTSVTFSSGGLYVLDTREIYQEVLVSDAEVAEGTLADDGPGVSLNPEFNRVSVNDQFQTYLEYKSEAPNSIWVTLAVLSWSWSASANFTDSWMIDPSSANYTANPTGQNSTTLPVWSSNVTSIVYQ